MVFSTYLQHRPLFEELAFSEYVKPTKGRAYTKCLDGYPQLCGYVEYLVLYIISSLFALFYTGLVGEYDDFESAKAEFSEIYLTDS